MLIQRPKSSKRVFGTNISNTSSTRPLLPNPSSSSKKIKLQPAPSYPSPPTSPTLPIYDYLISLSPSLTPKPHQPLHTSPSFFLKLRSIILQWLLNVHTEFSLSPATLYQAISIFDRTLSTPCSIKWRHEDLQLLATTALWMSSKYQEVYPPSIKQFVNLTCGACSVRQVVRAEEVIITEVLGFNMSFPTRYQMLCLNLMKKRVVKGTVLHHMCEFLCELSLGKVWEERENEVAEAAVFLAEMMVVGKERAEGERVGGKVKRVAYQLVGMMKERESGEGWGVMKKYDCEEKKYVGGYFVARKE